MIDCHGLTRFVVAPLNEQLLDEFRIPQLERMDKIVANLKPQLIFRFEQSTSYCAPDVVGQGPGFVQSHHGLNEADFIAFHVLHTSCSTAFFAASSEAKPPMNTSIV